jgi:hypothetical protein
VVVIVVFGNLFASGGNPGTTTTTTRKALPLGIGVKAVTWTNPKGLAVNPAPGGSAKHRTLLTEIWYPSLGASRTTPTNNASPDYNGGPYPVVVFAQGFNTLPSTYTALFDAWVLAGDVVVAPNFPDGSANEIKSLGPNPTGDQISIAESDVINEPSDVAYVANQVVAGSNGEASSGAAWLHGLAQPSKLALAGHSDGGQVIGALVYASGYAATYASMKVAPFAVEVLSGSEFPASEVGTYGPPTPAPPVLTVQSATDQCNLPQNAYTLHQAMGSGWFLKLDDAAHFNPYLGQGTAAPVIERTTTAFFGTATGAAGSNLQQAGDVSGISTIYSPSSRPTITPLPIPTPAQQAEACAVPAPPSI